MELILSEISNQNIYKANVNSNKEYYLYGKVITNNTLSSYTIKELNIYGVMVNSNIYNIYGTEGLNVFSNIINTTDKTKYIIIEIINANILQLSLNGNKRNQNNFNTSICNKIPKIYPYL